jgi:hypothetical protein
MPQDDAERIADKLVPEHDAWRVEVDGAILASLTGEEYDNLRGIVLHYVAKAIRQLKQPNLLKEKPSDGE